MIFVACCVAKRVCDWCACFACVLFVCVLWSFISEAEDFGAFTLATVRVMGGYLDAVCVSDPIIFLPVIEPVLDIIEMLGFLLCEVAVRRECFEVCFGCSVFFAELLVCFVSLELF